MIKECRVFSKNKRVALAKYDDVTVQFPVGYANGDIVMIEEKEGRYVALPYSENLLVGQKPDAQTVKKTTKRGRRAKIATVDN